MKDASLLHPLLPDTEQYALQISVVFGTYNRFALLQKSVASIRRACETYSYEIVIADGGSTDGTLAWLREQRDIVLIEGDLSGAVKAFNAAAKIAKGRYICCLNDDAELEPDAIGHALQCFSDPFVGQVAMSFLEHGQWKNQDSHGKTYGNFPVTRANIVRAAEQISGGMWATCYHTYGGDNELSCWVYRLGYKVIASKEARVRHGEHRDALRQRNEKIDKARHQYWRRWPNAEYMRFRGPQLGITAAEQAVLSRLEAGELPEARWPRITALDPLPGDMPMTAVPSRERVLHWHLWTEEDPQNSMAAALATLGSAGHVRIDWTRLAASDRTRTFSEAAKQLQPTLVFLQLQAADALPAEAIRAVRMAQDRDPSIIVCAWSGDVGPGKGPWPGMQDAWQYEIAKHVDLMLFTGTGQVDLHRERGMKNAAYLQIGYDVDRYHPGPEEGYGKQHTAVFLGQDYGSNFNAVPQNDAALRREIVARMRAIPGFAAYGGGFGTRLRQGSAGDTYRSSTLAISVSVTSALGRYTSDRMIRSMACGCPTFVKRFRDMEGMGLHDGTNCVVWGDADDLLSKVRHWLEPERYGELREIGRAGADLMQAQYTWEYRMRELAALLAAVRGQPRT